jgi:spermidine synthase
MIIQELRWARLLLVLSGAAALGWQFIWTTQWTLILGHEIYAVLAIAASFLGGLCLGTWFMASSMAQAANLLRIYVIAELVIAAWAAVLVNCLPSLSTIIANGLGEAPTPWVHAISAFVMPTLLLLPATFAMGATLPAMVGLLRGESKNMAEMYAANTFGACLGVAIIVFYMLPQWGVRQSAWALCAVNGLCALAAWLVWRNAEQAKVNVPTGLRFQGGSTLFFLGFWGMGYQVLAIRVLSLVTENTVYSYALLLMVYLAFHAMGAALFKRLPHTNRVVANQSLSLGVLIVSIFLGAMGLAFADKLAVFPSEVLGQSIGAALAGEGLAAMAGLALPSLAMGFVFTQQTTRNDQTPGWLGKSLSLNILGAALAPLVIGLLIFPAWGAVGVISLILLGYTLLQSFKSIKDAIKLWPICLAYLIVGGFLSWTFSNIPSGGKELFYRQGVMASVSVLQDVNNVAYLHINSRVQEGSSASSWVERRLAVLPMVLHPHPKDVLMLGLGTGFTANAAAEFAGDVQVEVVELLPEVIQASDIFSTYPNMPQPKRPVQKITADARRYINGTQKTFDVIVADVYHPSRSGAATLYTVEHFQKIKDRLNDGGVFCQWLALFQMDTETLRTIIAAYQSVYPDMKAVLVSNSLDSPAVGLIARKGAPWPLVSDLDKKWLDPELTLGAKRANLNDPLDVLGTVVADSESLRMFTTGTRPNTDDHLQVSFKAPWVTYAPQETPRARLKEVLSLWHVAPESTEPDEVQSRLHAYRQAHKLYLEMGLKVKANSDPFLLLNSIQEELFNLIKLSPEFHPAYETLNALANAISALHPDQSKAVLGRLQNLKNENTH